jgi:uncharacterized repeat protein (TIGR02059 family)
MKRRAGQFCGTLLIGVIALAVMNLLITPNRVWAQRPGVLETTFNSAVGTAFGSIVDIERDGSGNIYVAYGSTIKKISSAGATTLTITAATSVQAFAVDPAGNIIVATFGSSIYRYTAAGALDSTFNTNSYAGSTATGNYLSNSVLPGIGVQTVTNGRIIVASTGANNTQRLVGVQSLPTTTANAGKIDSTFTQTSITSTMGTPAGLFLDSANNIYVLGPASMGYVKRLSPNGTFSAADNTFNSAITSNLSATPKDITVDSSGNVYVVGDFTGRIKKFSSAGAPDAAYNTNTSTMPSGSLTTTLQSDGKLIVGGSFTGNLRRFNTDGTVDSTFTYNNATGGTVNKAVVLSDGFILAGTSSSPFLKKVYSVFLAPDAPGIPTAVAGDAQATVTATAPTTGPAPTGYTMTTVEDPTKTCTVTGATGNCTIIGLTNGTSYTFTSRSINGDKTSVSSSGASSSVTPVGVPPVFSSAAINSTGTVLTLTYNEALNSTTAPASQFTVIVSGQPATVTSATVSGSTVQLALDAVVIQGATVTVAYQAPSSSGLTSNQAIQDVAGTDAVSLSTTTVKNDSLAYNPSLK